MAGLQQNGYFWPFFMPFSIGCQIVVGILSPQYGVSDAFWHLHRGRKSVKKKLSKKYLTTSVERRKVSKKEFQCQIREIRAAMRGKAQIWIWPSVIFFLLCERELLSYRFSYFCQNLYAESNSNLNNFDYIFLILHGINGSFFRYEKMIFFFPYFLQIFKFLHFFVFFQIFFCSKNLSLSC